MASIKNLLFLFAILVSSTLTLAQSSDDPSSNVSSSIPPSDGGDTSEPPLPPLPSSAPGTFSHFTFKVPKFDFDWPQIPGAGFFSGGSRQKRSPAVGRQVINCNYNQEGGAKCIACHKVRTCYPMNKGTEYYCSGLFQYCNNGRCSRTKGGLCTSTTSTSTSTSTTGSTDSTSTTGSTDSTSTSSSSSSSSSSSTSTSTSTSSSSTSTSTTAAK